MTRRPTGGRARAFAFLALSTLLAALASALVLAVALWYGRELDGLARGEPTTPVMVAAREVWQGKTLDAADLELRDLPADYVPPSALLTPDQAIGRVPRERILAHEFIRPERLADPAAGVGLNAIIPRGMRGVSIDLADGAAVSGFLLPGNYVDVLVTLDGDGAEAQTVTLLQAVTVLAVNARTGGDAPPAGRPSVTVAVGPDQAESLSHAFAQGDVTLTLRSDIDVTQVETHGALSADLLGDDAGSGGDAERIWVRDWRAATPDQPTVTIISGPDQRIEPAGR